MRSRLRIGVAGVGVVGGALLQLVAEGGRRFEERFEITGICARDRLKPRPCVGNARWFDDARELASSEIDVFVELIGGSKGPAKDSIETALSRGLPVVTANKAILAEHGDALVTLAEANGASIAFEAAVAGAIPVVRAMRDGLSGARVTGVHGILNGTSNFLLSTMENEGCEYPIALREAQRLGYAEADPLMDVSGADARHKLAILRAIAFHASSRPDDIRMHGLERVTLLDLAAARRLGRRIKPIAKAVRNQAEVLAWVGPALVPISHPLAQVDGPLNAVLIDAEPIGRLTFSGPGAGGYATATAVLADLIDLAEGVRRPTFGLSAAEHSNPSLAAERHVAPWYVRIWVQDRPGTLAAVSEVLGAAGVSIDYFHQDASAQRREQAPIVLTTQPVARAALDEAVDAIARLSVVTEPPLVLPIENDAPLTEIRFAHG